MSLLFTHKNHTAKPPLRPILAMFEGKDMKKFGK